MSFRRGLAALREPVPGQLCLLELCLDPRDQAVLAFPRRHHFAERVDERVQLELGYTPTRYYQLLVGLLDRPDVAAADPDLVGRLQALRDQRAARRRRA